MLLHQNTLGLGNFKIGDVSSSRQGTGINQVQGPSTESRQEMRPEGVLETRIQQVASSREDNVVKVGMAAQA